MHEHPRAQARTCVSIRATRSSMLSAVMTRVDDTDRVERSAERAQHVRDDREPANEVGDIAALPLLGLEALIRGGVADGITAGVAVRADDPDQTFSGNHAILPLNLYFGAVGEQHGHGAKNQGDSWRARQDSNL